jgi:regulator of nonsense transcripts 2
LDLTKRNYGKILKQIRRLHWEEKEVVVTLHKIFSKPGKIKYGNIHLLAILLSALYRYHTDFVVSVIDTVIESVVFGLEQNDFRFNQRRIAEVKYIGELYNYRMLEHPVVFEIMYKIMTMGHGGPPLPGRINPFDTPEDYFRIRLISTILETCGMYFNRGAAGKKLDYFLSFFQYYIYTKNPLPMDIEFIVQDIFSLTRPQWKLASNLEEATKAFQLAVAQDQKTSGLDKLAEADDGMSGGSSDEDNGDDLDLVDPEDDDESGSEDGEAEQEAEVFSERPYIPTLMKPCTNRVRIGQDRENRQSSSEIDDDDDEDIFVTREQEEVDPEDEADFEREYAKMMAESLDSRKFERKQQFDLPLPLRTKTRETSALNDGGEQDAEAPSRGPTMAFSLLTKKGNRQQVRDRGDSVTRLLF